MLKKVITVFTYLSKRGFGFESGVRKKVIWREKYHVAFFQKLCA
ncbi:MAG: hypothetical protein Q4Q19_09385 [Methanobrevibacter sp.]|nr:hypothetical protein [Methanobrevibacter sp.]